MSEFELYRVKRADKEPLLRFICEALEQSGATVLEASEPSVAPFQITIRTSKGERLRLIVYAFFANKYEQGGRPGDEHRFQIKYGSDFKRYHNIFIASDSDRVTLMCGVHLREGVVVAVDPAMHNPTWFSSSVEFKSKDIQRIKQQGWCGWERERSHIRRKRPMPRRGGEEENLQVEALLGLESQHFERYVLLERIATSTKLDAAERLLLIDRVASEESMPVVRHPLEEALDMSAQEILGLIDERLRLKVALMGGAAEKHLESLLRKVAAITKLRRIDEDGRPDFEVEYRKKGPLYVECKNVLRRSTRERPQVDFQKTRASIGDPCSRFYKSSDFDVLAACLHPVSGKWEYSFRWTKTIEQHKKCPTHLTTRVVVGSDGLDWTHQIDRLLESITAEKRR